MASYTMELREIIEQATQFDDDLSYQERIEKGKKNLFDFKYPIFDEDYRNVFETNFIKHFYMREIGFETDGLFKFRLDTWLNINMPYFNKLYESELLKFDPLINSKMDITYNKKNDKTQNDTKDIVGTSTGTSFETSGKTGNHSTNTTNNETNTGSKTSEENRTLDETETVSQTTESETTNTQETESTVSSDANTKTDTETEQNTFNRELKSNNPDSRLSITPNADGSGVIEYASEINENKGTNSSTDKVNSTNKTSSESLDSTTGETLDTSFLDSEKTENEQENTTVTESDNRTINNTQNTTGSNSENVTSNSNDSKRNEIDETTKSVINDVEDFVQHRVGKLGVTSYSKMVQEYRETFIRIEQQIFKEMNELFMLVY